MIVEVERETVRCEDGVQDLVEGTVSNWTCSTRRVPSLSEVARTHCHELWLSLHGVHGLSTYTRMTQVNAIYRVQ